MSEAQKVVLTMDDVRQKQDELARLNAEIASKCDERDKAVGWLRSVSILVGRDLVPELSVGSTPVGRKTTVTGAAEAFILQSGRGVRPREVMNHLIDSGCLDAKGTAVYRALHRLIRQRRVRRVGGMYHPPVSPSQS